jgi:hypothetical protein
MLVSKSSYVGFIWLANVSSSSTSNLLEKHPYRATRAGPVPALPVPALAFVRGAREASGPGASFALAPKERQQELTRLSTSDNIKNTSPTVTVAQETNAKDINSNA